MKFEECNDLIKNSNGVRADLKRVTSELYYQSMIKVLNKKISRYILSRTEGELTVSVKELISRFMKDVPYFYLRDVSELTMSFVAYRESIGDALERLENKLNDAEYKVKFFYSGDGSYESFIREAKFKINF